MSTIASKLALLRDRLESIAFLVSTGEGAKHVHSEIVKALVIVADAERACLENTLERQEAEVVQVSSEKSEYRNEYFADHPTRRHSARFIAEVEKVRNRLQLWARPDRQQQINSQILNAFLRLESSGVSTIRESDLRRQLPSLRSFETNFAQMKIFAERNHGKIFDSDGDVVTVWEPVLPYVREYQKAVSGAH